MQQQTRERSARLAARPALRVSRPTTAAPSSWRSSPAPGNRVLVESLGRARPGRGRPVDEPLDAGAGRRHRALPAPRGGRAAEQPERVLTAEQAAAGRRPAVLVVPTRSIPAGLAAMVAYDASRDAADNAPPHAVGGSPASAPARSRPRCATPPPTACPSTRATTWRCSTAASWPPGPPPTAALREALAERLLARRRRDPHGAARRGPASSRRAAAMVPSRPRGGASRRSTSRSTTADSRTTRCCSRPSSMADETLTTANTAIVLDSTADLPQLAERPNLRIVPLTVQLRRPGVPRPRRPRHRGRSTPSWLPAGSPRPPPRRRRRRSPTSTPSSSDAGYEHVVSLHISGKLSATVQSARLAAADVGDQVTVLDTRSASAGIALGALKVLELLDEGTTLAAIEAYVRPLRRRPAGSCSRSRRSSTCSAAGGSARRRRCSAACSRCSRCCPCATARSSRSPGCAAGRRCSPRSASSSSRGRPTACRCASRWPTRTPRTPRASSSSWSEACGPRPRSSSWASSARSSERMAARERSE